jgi:hypothetical protein
MSNGDPAFRWDEHGINAYDKETVGDKEVINPRKFVRFDRHGLYGIDAYGEDETYQPEALEQIHRDANFALTWNGLTVETEDGAKLHLGKQDGKVFSITDKEKKPVLSIDNIG